MKTTALSDEQRRQFVDEGYFILESVIPDEHLDIVRRELDGFIDEVHADMDALGSDVAGLNHRGKRYFISNRHKKSERLPEFLYSELMADICRATLGDDAYLFLEQYVVKAAEVGLKFSWHQDSGYLKPRLPSHERPYLTCWCALDDMSEENGTIYVLPYSRAGTKEIVTHEKDEDLNDLVGYFGDDPGEPVIVPAGSIAVFSTTVFHRSGSNRTDRPRRSYVVQYSGEPIMRDEETPFHFAEPFLKDGSILARR